MALFGWKKSESADGKDAAGVSAAEAPGAGGTSAGGETFEPQPDKARKWFDAAKTAAETYNYEYALACYANGIKFDPSVMSAHEAIYKVALQYMDKGGKPASGKEVKGFDDGTPVGKFAGAEFAWMKDIANPSLALAAIEAAIKVNQLEYGHWIAARVLAVLRRAKKVSKRTLIQAKDLFKQVNAWDQALEAGQMAVRLDPSDNALDHELKDISAQRAMDAGGYEKAAGKEGGFRTFVKDADKQRQLVESESITANASIEERNMLRAKADYEKSPKVPDVINLYAQLIKKKGTPEAEQQAHDIYMKGYADTGEYRFRMAAGDIKLEALRREYDALLAKSDENPDDAALKSQVDAARRRLYEAEAPEIAERVSKYGTDRPLKLRLGEVEFGLGNYQKAMVALQAAKDEPKLRVRAGHLLGRSFAAEAWHMDAISEYKEALTAIDATERDRELAIRYDLMVSLIEHARAERDISLAKEALDICSGIVRKNISYRDIRSKRKDVDDLIKQLSGGKSQ